MRVREATVTYQTSNRPGIDRKIARASDVVELARTWVLGKMKEHFFVIMLDTKHQYICHELVSMGNLDSTIVHPREVFTTPVREQAAAVILIHNHPSNDCTPSEQDRAVTTRMIRSGEILGIEVLDHLIISDTESFSFRDSGEM